MQKLEYVGAIRKREARAYGISACSRGHATLAERRRRPRRRRAGA